MRLSRRGFVRSLGLGTVGVLSSRFIIARGREETAFGSPTVQQPYDDGLIRISSNENARGPGPNAIQALHDTISPRAGRGYPPDHVNDLVEVIAKTYGVDPDNVIVGTGSGPILEGSVHAFCSADRGLVTAAPTFGTTESEQPHGDRAPGRRRRGLRETGQAAIAGHRDPDRRSIYGLCVRSGGADRDAVGARAPGRVRHAHVL